jgi:hypothetical protein
MRTGTLVAVGAAVALAATAGVVIANSDHDEPLAENGVVSDDNSRGLFARNDIDCRVVATNETGFDPATTPYPVREDAGNKQVLKGTGAGAAVGAIAGEVIGGKPGLGAAAGAAAGAAGGQAIKKDKQNDADARYEAAVASYNQQKAAYDEAVAECRSD